MDLPNIFRNNVKTNFWLELITNLSLYFSFNKNFKFLSLLFLLRIITLAKLYKKFKEEFLYNSKISDFLSLIKIIFLILFFSHICACIMHYIAIYMTDNYNTTQTWIYFKNLENKNWKIRYLNAFYFSIVTQVTVGYGDISPQNSIEKIAAMYVSYF